jgi:hypothetical protein
MLREKKGAGGTGLAGILEEEPVVKYRQHRLETDDKESRRKKGDTRSVCSWVSGRRWTFAPMY